MIHIIDPRTQSPLPDFHEMPASTNSWTYMRHRGRWINDRNMHSAELVAIRTPKGLYQVLKWRYDKEPVRPIRRKTLQRYIDQALDARELKFEVGT